MKTKMKKEAITNFLKELKSTVIDRNSSYSHAETISMMHLICMIPFSVVSSVLWVDG